MADLRSLSGVQRIALHGLGADEVAEIMTAVAGHELEGDGIELAAQIAQETDGNPFFVGEILLGLSEFGALVFDEAGARWSTDQLGQPTLPWFDCFTRAGLELLHGDLAAGERLAERAFQLGQEAGQPDAVLIYGAQVAFIRAYQARGDEIIEMLRQSASAFVGAARGDPAAARDHAALALELSREHGYVLFEPRAAALVEAESAAEN